MDEDDELDDWKETRGRKPSPYPMFLKKFRALEAERKYFLELCPDDAREGFLLIFDLLKNSQIQCVRCGKPVSVFKVYRCFDCDASFHKDCLIAHCKEG